MLIVGVSPSSAAREHVLQLPAMPNISNLSRPSGTQKFVCYIEVSVIEGRPLNRVPLHIGHTMTDQELQRPD